MSEPVKDRQVNISLDSGDYDELQDHARIKRLRIPALIRMWVAERLLTERPALGGGDSPIAA